jgi:hypothetical protein
MAQRQRTRARKTPIGLKSSSMIGAATTTAMMGMPPAWSSPTKEPRMPRNPPMSETAMMRMWVMGVARRGFADVFRPRVAVQSRVSLWGGRGRVRR